MEYTVKITEIDDKMGTAMMDVGMVPARLLAFESFQNTIPIITIGAIG